MVVEFLTPKVTPAVRPAGQVSTAKAQQLSQAGTAMQMAADTFTQYYEEKALLAGNLILAKAEEYWTREYANRKKGVGFSETLLSDYDAYVEQAMEDYQTESTALGMANLPARNKEELLNQFAISRLKLETSSLQAEAAARAAAVARAEQEILNAKANTLISRIELNPDDPSIIADLARMTEGMDADSTTYLHRVYLNGMIEHNPARVNEMIAQGDFDAHLTPSQKQTLLNNSRINLAALSDKAAAEHIVEINEANAFAQANGISDVSEDRIDLIRTDERLTDETREELIGLAEDGVRISMAMHNIRNMTPQQRYEHLVWLQSRVQTEGSTVSDVADRDAFITAESDFVKNLSEDPAFTAIFSNQAVANKWNKFLNAVPTSHEDTELGLMGHVPSKEELFADFASHADAWFDEQAIPLMDRTYIPLEGGALNIEDLVASLNTNEFGTVAMQLKSLERMFGDKYGSVLNQMMNNDLKPIVSLAARHINDPVALDLIKEIINIPFEDLKKAYDIPNRTFSDLEGKIASEVEEYGQAFRTGSGSATFYVFRSMVQTTQKAVMDLVVNKGLGVNEAVQEAVKAFFPEKVYYLPEQNVSVVVPTHIVNDAGESVASNGGTIVEALTYLANNPDYWDTTILNLDIDDYTIQYGLPVEGANEALTAASVKERGMFVNSPDRKGVVLLHRTESDWSFAMIRHEESGDPVFISWEDLDKVGVSLIALQASEFDFDLGGIGVVGGQIRPPLVPRSAVMFGGKWINPVTGLEYDPETGVEIESF